MGNASISKRGDGYVTIKFEDYGYITKTEVPNLSVPRSGPAAATVGGYALFAGGYTGSSGYTDTIDFYNTDLVRGSAKLSVARGSIAAATLTNGGISYALFGGGSSGAGQYSTVEAYNSSLTRSTPTELSVARSILAATTVGNYVLFGGGSASGYSQNVVDAYNSNLARSTPTKLSVSRGNLAAAGNYFYGFFGGGVADGIARNTVDAYDTKLARSTPAPLDVARWNLAATNNGSQTLFAGGREDYSVSYDISSVADVYDSYLTKSTPVYLSQAKQSLGAASAGEYALFGGGYTSPTSYGATFDTVDGFEAKTLIRKTNTNLSSARYALGATNVENCVIFAGGSFHNGTNASSAEAYRANYTMEISVYKGTKYKFQNMSAEGTIDSDFSVISIPMPATGYIKFKKVTIS